MPALQYATSSITKVQPATTPPACSIISAGGDRTAGGQQIVDHQHPAARPDDGIGVDLQGVGAIFEVVGMRKRLARQLSRLANGNQPCVELQGKRGGKR